MGDPSVSGNSRMGSHTDCGVGVDILVRVVNFGPTAPSCSARVLRVTGIGPIDSGQWFFTKRSARRKLLVCSLSRPCDSWQRQDSGAAMVGAFGVEIEAACWESAFWCSALRSGPCV